VIAQLQAAGRNALRTGTILFAFALVATALLVFTFIRTQPTIERSQQAEKLALLGQVLPHALYDNDLLASVISVPPDELLGTRQPSSIWIARRGEQITAVALEAIAPDGYSGNIHLVVGIDVDGTVTGVRVTAHRETPGLGDYIVRSKSPWIEQFVGKSLTTPGQTLESRQGRRRFRRPRRRHHHPARGGQGRPRCARLFCATPRGAARAAPVPRRPPRRASRRAHQGERK
jgi:Na+-translocating ferredoxin:NAD+ oxidoreductase subunit G